MLVANELAAFQEIIEPGKHHSLCTFVDAGRKRHRSVGRRVAGRFPALGNRDNISASPLSGTASLLPGPVD